MAEGEYRRLTCTVESCQGAHQAHGYCMRHYRQWQRGGIRQDATKCAHCDAEFQPPHVGTIYCSKRCKLAAWKAANSERFKAYPSNQRKVSAVYAGYCETCGGAFVSRRERRWCSDACERGHGREWVRGVSYLPPVRTCRHCDLQWTSLTRGSPQACPSPECQAAERRRLRRAEGGRGHVQRAKRAGVPYRYFSERTVLRRDRWTCQLCGIPTPEEARGITRPDAPEFDHCIPIALGGPHLPENGQCLCRRCNGEKADSWCEQSAARAIARGVRVAARPNRKAVGRALRRAPRNMDRGQIEAPAPA